MTISHMLQSLLLKGEGILCKITAMMVAGLNKGCTDEFFDSKWHKVQCLTVSLNLHSKTGTANILQWGGLSKKC